MRSEYQFTDNDLDVYLIITFLLKEIIKKSASNRVTFKFA